jgi:hypothetical protein
VQGRLHHRLVEEAPGMACMVCYAWRVKLAIEEYRKAPIDVWPAVISEDRTVTGTG